MLRNIADRSARVFRRNSRHGTTGDAGTSSETTRRPRRPRQYLAWPTRVIDQLIDTSSILEKVLLGLLIITLIASSGVLVWRVNQALTITNPSQGGSLVEGVVGSPQFINPLLASSDADHDLVSLVYSGLIKQMPDGRLVYDLAQDIDISDDKTTYTVTLKPDVTFHDGTPVTARDVAYTVRQAQNPQLRSPVRGDWTGVTVEIVDRQTVRFQLDEPYAPFIQNLTLGIMPAHIWKSLDASQVPSSPHNHFSPIGSGPYKVESTSRQEGTGLATYTLTPFSDYTLGEPYIDTLTIRSFADSEAMTEALADGRIDSAGGIDPGVAPSIADKNTVIKTAHLPRVFAIFFNQNNHDAFTDEVVREALTLATDKQAIIEQVLNGYATETNSPIPAGLGPKASSSPGRFQHAPDTASTSREKARQMLAQAGWEQTGTSTVRRQDGTKLSLSLATADTPELVTTAHMISDMWSEVGVEVNVEVYASGNLNQEVIRPRDYEALLFGEIVGRNRDYYPFWHSSQQNDPGLNVAQYANIEVDELLEEARRTVDPQELRSIQRRFAGLVAADNPAVFLYTPQFVYMTPKRVQNATIGPVTTQPQRFNTVHDWFIDTAWQWSMFKGYQPTRETRSVLQNN